MIIFDGYQKNNGIGNQFFINMSMYFLSNKYKIYTEYLKGDSTEHGTKNSFKKLCIFENNTNYLKKKNNKKIIVDETKLLELLNEEIIFDYNSDYIFKGYFQRGKNNKGDEIPRRILKLFSNENCIIRKKIIENNNYKNRYNTNNDLVIHLRIKHPSNLKKNSKYDIFPLDHYKWYEKLINQINYDNIYICSDLENCDIINMLKKKYNAKFIKLDSIETLKFASTCKNVILSLGTYSWLLGLFSFYSNVYYFDFYNNPTTLENREFTIWSPEEMFFASNWNKINLK